MDDPEMDDLVRLIRAARPPSGNRYMPLTDRAKRELAELIMSASHSTATAAPPRPRRRSGWIRRARYALIATVVALVAITGSILAPGFSPPAQAATPPMLAIEPIVQPAETVLAQLAQAAAARHTPPTASDEDVVIRMHTWALSIEEVSGQIDPSATVISPEVHTYTFRSDGSMSQVVTAGQAYDETGSPVEQQIAPGTVVGTLELGPGEYAPLFTEPAPRDSDEVEAFLTLGGGLPAGDSASDAFMTIRHLLSEQRLDNLQTAALIEFIATLPDYTVEGTTTDRLARLALVLSAPRANGEYTDSLLLDPMTGQVLGFETTYTGTSRTDLTAPAVTTYLAWENDT